VSDDVWVRVPAGAGRAYDFHGARVVIKASGQDTLGSLTVGSRRAVRPGPAWDSARRGRFPGRLRSL